MNAIKIVIVLFLVIITGGCSTSAHFKIPDGSKLYIFKREQPVNVAQDGRVVTKPFFWTATAGIPYRLETDWDKLDILRNNYGSFGLGIDRVKCIYPKSQTLWVYSQRHHQIQKSLNGKAVYS